MSAGLLLYRQVPDATEGRTDGSANAIPDGPPPATPGDPPGLEVLLVHPGGPLWARRDDGAWSIPKGEREADEEPLAAAEREVAEELGRPVPAGHRLPLGELVQRGGKRVTAWAVEADLDPATVRSNTFEMEWPPRSGARRTFPEVDRAAWLPLAAARRKLLPSQVPFLDRLAAALTAPPRRHPGGVAAATDDGLPAPTSGPWGRGTAV